MEEAKVNTYRVVLVNEEDQVVEAAGVKVEYGVLVFADVDGTVLHAWSVGEWERCALVPRHDGKPEVVPAMKPPAQGSREELVEALRPFGEAYMFALETFKGEAWAQWEASVAEAGLAVEDLATAAGIVGG